MEPTSTTTPPPEQRLAFGQRRPRPSATARRFGYAVAVVANLVLIYLTYVRPGWRAVPFLTEEARHVVPWFVLSLMVAIGVNLVWIVWDPLWLRSLGDLVTSVIGVVVMARFLDVFPFSADTSWPWETVARTVLIVGLVASVIGVVVNLVMFIGRIAQPRL